MQISAGFGAAKDKFAGSVGHKFDRGYPVPIRFQMTLFFLPQIFLKRDPSAGNKVDGMAVELKTMRDVRGGEPQNDRISFIDTYACWGVPEPSRVDRDVSRGSCLWYQSDSEWNQQCQLKTEENQKNRSFFTHFHNNMISGE
jgi:hypothetical protein